jgi:hypothetical protein
MPDRSLTPSLAAVATLRGHPGYQSAMREAVRSMITLYRADRLLNALMSDRARALFTHGALYLHYRGLRNGQPGLTVGAMKDFCVELKLCSRGRCEAMMALMRAAGLFSAAPNPDRRRRLLVPTEKLFKLHRERWLGNIEAMRHIMPQAESWLAALHGPAFVEGLVVALSQSYIAGLRVLDNVPLLEKIVERNAGLMILFSLALSGPADQPFAPAVPVELSINALATQFSVSRKHVLILLRDAEALELLIRGGPANSQITFLPKGREALETMLGTMFLFLAESADKALRTSAAVHPTAALVG